MTNYWPTGRLTAFDVETTGVEATEDRIVTAAVVHIDGDTVQSRHTVVDPGVPVPDEAAEVHGWTTARVQAEGKPPAGELEWIAADLADSLAQGVPVVVANAPYDLTLLHHELLRHRLPTLPDRLDGKPVAPVVDPMVIDKYVDTYRRGKRRLPDLCEWYQVTADTAHDAAADALAAAQVVRRLGELARSPHDELVQRYHERRAPAQVAARHTSLARMDLGVLHRHQIDWHREQAESLAAYFRKKAAAATDESEAAEFHQKAATVHPDWPMRM